MPAAKGWPQFPGRRGTRAPVIQSSPPPPYAALQRQRGELIGASVGGGVSKNLVPRSAPSAPEQLCCPQWRRALIGPEAAAPGSLLGHFVPAQVPPELLLCDSPGRRPHPHGDLRSAVRPRGRIFMPHQPPPSTARPSHLTERADQAAITLRRAWVSMALACNTFVFYNGLVTRLLLNIRLDLLSLFFGAF
ncbi:hypothetical protein NDU88_006262 [Pleurodeles waltl]|uniref:Uncharacterized protein n=1 Tax=Pleurodeles waltl TaxID=8319 RepID=A0AAV7RNG6_PLEWA|nr:hypothetical protein NDU88_006262 [Pleurodeles waltl]